MHTETVMIYFDDLDAMGIVHNGRTSPCSNER